MVAPAWTPKMRLSGKHSVQQHCRKLRLAKRTRKTQRSQAIAEGLAPKACRPFALYFKKHTRVRKGATKAEHAAEMKRLGKVWKGLPSSEQEEYRAQCQDQFQAQRETLRIQGVNFRCKGNAKAHAEDGASEEVAEASGGNKHFEIGQFRCWTQDSSDGSCLYVGEGSYGAVLMSQTESGRKAVVKVFKHASRSGDLDHEAAILQRLQDELVPGCRCWFPEVLCVERRKVPFPHMALDYGGPSLHTVLATKGPLSQPSARSVAQQLKAALEALHGIGILHLDLKPANVLWLEDLWQLKLIDFGMSEAFSPAAFAAPAASVGPAAHAAPAAKWPNGLRFNQYVSASYRPPELWGLKPDEVLDAVSPSVDTWCYYCTLYEAVTGRVLMSPMKGCHEVGPTVKHVLQAWCQTYAEIRAAKRGRRVQRDKYHFFNVRLLRSGAWQQTFLTGLNPEPKLRALPSLGQLPS
eukprot:s3667_g5.t1